MNRSPFSYCTFATPVFPLTMSMATSRRPGFSDLTRFSVSNDSSHRMSPEESPGREMMFPSESISMAYPSSPTWVPMMFWLMVSMVMSAPTTQNHPVSGSATGFEQVIIRPCPSRST